MIIAAHQPNFLPNLAFFNKMKTADLFVIITNLQFEKQEGWQQRHKIKGPNGDIWLTVPVLGSQNQKIKDVKINNQVNWRKKHQKTIRMVYAKSKGEDLIDEINSIYGSEPERLVEVNYRAILKLKDILGIETKVVLDDKVSGNKHELIINICKKYKADTYLSGVGALDYMTKERLAELKKNNIKHKFVEKNLTSLYPYSTLHYLLSEGREWILNVI
ncbi:MAG: WbqC-like protein family protein [Candidatus Curtissbacteria bacterium GW2011_GWA1_41_11]|uniref:WbqC-like protein family protein n=1 Tax=Candidatus Curtissbacteria bacterium GW2011_GWA1_41_11 TaxID=1618409 RepID=A0A0G0XFY3_9BACT|nr:MAG: WbqC-like protein family protein [Candidatus Curtissbacteria bacterium GW2011_GWA1_41_11]